MNTPDPFEKRLSEIAMRTVPAGWRSEILRGTPHQAGQASEVQSPESGAMALLHQWFWPHPAAWGTLAAVWVVIFALNIASGVTLLPLARRAVATPPSPEMLALLREQRALLRSLLAEPTPPPPAVDAKPSARWLRQESASWVAATISKSWRLDVFGVLAERPSESSRGLQPTGDVWSLDISKQSQSDFMKVAVGWSPRRPHGNGTAARRDA